MKNMTKKNLINGLSRFGAYTNWINC